MLWKVIYWLNDLLIQNFTLYYDWFWYFSRFKFCYIINQNQWPRSLLAQVEIFLSNSCLEEMCQEYARNIGNTEVLCKKDRMVLVLLPSGHEEVLTSSKHGRYRNPKKFVLLGS